MEKQLTAQQWGMMIGRKIEVEICGEKLISILTAVKLIDFDIQLDFACGACCVLSDRYCKPILRTIDQATAEEASEFDLLSLIQNNIFTTDWLTQKGFDIRNWTDAGLAIKYDKEVHGEWR